MGKFSDYITGGNPKIVCRLVSEIYDNHNSDYDRTIYEISLIILSNYNKSKNPDQINLLLNEISNLSQISILYLNSFCAPRGTYFSETWDHCGNSIMNYLIKFGIQQDHALGENPLPEELKSLLE